MGKSLAFRMFIKSAVDQKNLKLGVYVVIAQTISTVQKNSIAIATCLEEFNFLAPISQTVYYHDDVMFLAFLHSASKVKTCIDAVMNPDFA